MDSDDARALVLRVRAAFDVTPSPDKERQLLAAIERMPLDAGTAAVDAMIDTEETFPRGPIAALNRHAKTFGWEPPRAFVMSTEERAMRAQVRERFATVYGPRADDAATLEYYGLLGAFRWAMRSGTWPAVKVRVPLLGEQASGAAAHVEMEARTGRLEPAIRQEGLL